MAIVLALAAAVSWGSSDFFAGLASRRASAINVVVGAHLVGLLSLVVLAPIFSGNSGGSDFFWGVAGGMSGGIGAALLYRGLAVGRMAVVAPITGAGAAVVPVVFGILTGDLPGLIALLGIALALVAIVLVAIAPAPTSADKLDLGKVRRVTGRSPGADFVRGRSVLSNLIREPGLTHAVASGLGFGGFYVFISYVNADSGLWSLLAARAGSVLLLGGAALVIERRVLPPPDVRSETVLVGVLDVTAAALFLMASREGMLSVVSVLTSLYPTVTVLLALFVAHERCSKLQFSGMALAGLAIGLIATA